MYHCLYVFFRHIKIKQDERKIRKRDRESKLLYVFLFSRISTAWYAWMPPSLWHSLCITFALLYIDSGWGFRWCQWVRRTAACTWSLRATMSSSPRRMRDICDRVRVMAQHWAAKLGRCNRINGGYIWMAWQHFDFYEQWERKQWHVLVNKNMELYFQSSCLWMLILW